MDARRSRPVLGVEGEAGLSGTGWIAIVNPKSGGRSAASLASVRSSLQGHVDALIVSDRAGAVETIVAEHRGACGFVVAGGDGTIFEVLQACDRARQRLAVLPLGRGNSLARDLGVATLARALETLTHGVDEAIDLLDVVLHTDDGAEWHGVSASNLAIGYPADVARLARGFRRLGAHSYTAAGVVARPRAFGAHVRVDDGQEKDESLTGAIISNSRYVGPFLGFPRASLSDGVCHTMTLRAGLARQLLHNLSSVTRLRFYEPGVTTDMRTIRLRLDAPMLVKIDGELREGVRAIEVRVLAQAVTFRVPGARRG